MSVDSENQIRILESWYKRLDNDYHDGTPEDPCMICVEAQELGILPDGEPNEVGQYE